MHRKKWFGKDFNSKFRVIINTHYSGSLTKSKAHKTSCNTGVGIKLFPSGSKDLNTRRATSDGVSCDTRLVSVLNNTEIVVIIEFYY